MTQTEIRLIEEGWAALVEQLGFAEATRFVMLLDRRTGGALQHLQRLWSGQTSGLPYQVLRPEQPPVAQFETQ
jgi:hypothetical protein